LITADAMHLKTLIRVECHLPGFHGNNTTTASNSCLKIRTVRWPTATAPVALLALSVWGPVRGMVLGWGIQSEQLQVSYYELCNMQLFVSDA